MKTGHESADHPLVAKNRCILSTLNPNGWPNYQAQEFRRPSPPSKHRAHFVPPRELRGVVRSRMLSPVFAKRLRSRKISSATTHRYRSLSPLLPTPKRRKPVVSGHGARPFLSNQRSPGPLGVQSWRPERRVFPQRPLRAAAVVPNVVPLVSFLSGRALCPEATGSSIPSSPTLRPEPLPHGEVLGDRGL